MLALEKESAELVVKKKALSKQKGEAKRREEIQERLVAIADAGAWATVTGGRVLLNPAGGACSLCLWYVLRCTPRVAGAGECVLGNRRGWVCAMAVHGRAVARWAPGGARDDSRQPGPN